MGENELYQIAFYFREAIVAAKTNGEFNFRVSVISQFSPIKAQKKQPKQVVGLA